MRMRAAVFEGPRQVRIESLPVRKPPAGQVLVRLEGSGICGGDLPLWQGRSRSPYPQPPGRPGHEGWGIVSALGAGVESLRIGDRVSGIFDGAFAEMSEVAAERIVKLPRRLDGMRFPGEPLACALNAFQRSGIGPGQTVAIIGIGFVGAVMAQLASRAGATVVAVGRRDHALEAARKSGVPHTLRLADDVVGYVRELTRGGFCDVVVEATGHQEPLDLAGRLVRERGRLVIVGYHQTTPRTIDAHFWSKNVEVVNAYQRDPDAYLQAMRQAIQMVARRELDPGPFITHRFPLEKIHEGFATLEERPDGFLKAVLEI